MIPFLRPVPASVAHTRQSHVRLFRRRLKASDPRSWNLKLASAGTGVPVRMGSLRPA
jgi:hypothetical protein